MPIHDRMTPTATNQSKAQTEFSDSTHCSIRWKFSFTLFTNTWPWNGPFNSFILEPTSSPGRFQASNGDTEFNAASVLRWQRHFSVGWCNDVNTLERCSCGRFAALMVGNPSRFLAQVVSRAVRSALPASKCTGWNDGRVAVLISGGLTSWLLSIDARYERVEILLCTEGRRATGSIYNLFIPLSQCGNDWYSLLQSVMGKPLVWVKLIWE